MLFPDFLQTHGLLLVYTGSLSRKISASGPQFTEHSLIRYLAPCSQNFQLEAFSQHLIYENTELNQAAHGPGAQGHQS